MKFVDASYTELGVVVNGFYLVEGNYATYIGQSGPNSKNWWFWQFYVDDEDIDRLSEIMTNGILGNKYETCGYSENSFSSLAECVTAATRDWKAKKKKKYRVEITQTVEVEAYNEDEATEIAQDMIGDWNCYISEIK